MSHIGSENEYVLEDQVLEGGDFDSGPDTRRFPVVVVE